MSLIFRAEAAHLMKLLTVRPPTWHTLCSSHTQFARQAAVQRVVHVAQYAILGVRTQVSEQDHVGRLQRAQRVVCVAI